MVEIDERNERNEIIEYYVIHVIQPILEIIPSNELKLIREIKEFESKLYYKSPHALCGYCLDELLYILQVNIKEIDKEWKKQLVKIINLHTL
jgi:hypothetical protein